MLKQDEAKELVLRSAFQRRRPSHAFIADRLACKARRLREGRPYPFNKGDRPDWIALWGEYTGAVAGGASFFNLVLDTTAPGGATLVLNGGATYATSLTLSAVLHTSDSPTTGYQIKIWGTGIDETANASIQEDEVDSSWISPTWSSGDATQAVVLSAGDGLKTISAKIRDDVWNETAELTDTITLDTVAPVVTISSGPDVTKISKVSGKRVATFAWQSDTAYQAYKVKVVPASGSAESAGTTLLTTNGSTNVSGGAGAATTDKTTTIDGRDLEVASAGDGTKVIKVFVQDLAGNWSTA